MSKISKALDQTPSSVTSTPRTPRIDLAARLAGKTKKEKEKEKKEKEKGLQVFPSGSLKIHIKYISQKHNVWDIVHNYDYM